MGYYLKSGLTVDQRKINPTLAKAIKGSAIAALIGSALLRPAPRYIIVFHVVITTAAVVVLSQAATMRRHVWMALFLVVACLFNPVFPVPLSKYTFEIATAFAG